MRYDFTIRQIQNGWLFISELPSMPPVTLHFNTELEALVALKLATELAISSTIKEKAE